MTVIETEPSFIPVQTRSERPKSTIRDDFAALTGREAAFKYTPVAELSALSDGPLDGAPLPIRVSGDAVGFAASLIERTDERIGGAGLPEDRLSAAAWQAFDKAQLLSITGEDAQTVTVVRDSAGAAPRAAHTVIEVAPNARATLVIENSGDAQLTENVEVLVGDGAHLTLVTVQQWADSARHVASHFVRAGRDATITHIVVTLGGALVRLNPSAHLVGDGSSAQLLGAYFADAGQHLEHQVYVFHEGPHTTSRVTYKGALQGKDAHTVWIGDVLIGPKAVGTDSYEQNRNLVLTEGARADSVPNLEIETGDIIGAGHASATGRFDDEQLFYLESRGIPEEEARRLVVRGFLAEIVQQIGVPELEERLTSAIEAELSEASVA